MQVIERDSLDDLLGALRRRGYRTVGPVLRDGAIVYDEIASADELPAGWTEIHDAGRYRVERRDDGKTVWFEVDIDGDPTTIVASATDARRVAAAREVIGDDAALVVDALLLKGDHRAATGLLMSWHLQQAGRSHVVLDRRETLGGGWQDRWNAFRLVGPNWTTDLPGYLYDGSDPDGFMTRDEVVARGAQRRYRQMHCGLAARGRDRAHPALERRDAFLEHGVRRIRQPRIHVPCALDVEETRGEIGVRKYERGRLIDRRRARSGRRIRTLPDRKSTRLNSSHT